MPRGLQPMLVVYVQESVVKNPECQSDRLEQTDLRSKEPVPACIRYCVSPQCVSLYSHGADMQLRGWGKES